MVARGGWLICRGGQKQNVAASIYHNLYAACHYGAKLRMFGARQKLTNTMLLL